MLLCATAAALCVAGAALSDAVWPSDTGWIVVRGAAALGVAASLTVLLFSVFGALHRVEAVTAALLTMRTQGWGPLPGGADDDEVGALARAAARLVYATKEDLAQAAGHAEDAKLAHGEKAALNRHIQDFGAVVSGVIGELGFSAQAMEAFAGELVNGAVTAQNQARDTSASASESSAQLAAVADAVEQISASVNEISGRVADTASETRQAVAQVAASDVAVRGLADSVAQIDSITGLIRSVAARTNLLALNATIEAARAGEAGRGFAVVAGEVKNLATQTAKATEDISRQIAAIRGSTTGAVAAMREVAATTRRIDDAASAIAAAVEQQGAIAREIAGKVQHVSHVTTTTAAAMAQLSDATDQAQMTSSVVLDAAGNFGRQTQELRGELDEFLTALDGIENNRRRYQRRPLHGVTVTAELADSQVTGSAIDISCGGISLGVEALAEPGMHVQVSVPGDPAPLAGRVVRASDGTLAISFRQDPATLARLEALVASLTAGAAA
jgi:methyl-accepting chemotaxis protein